jgi:hypothetical protein
MGDVIDLLPGSPEIRKELTSLHQLQNSLVTREWKVIAPGGADVTAREAANLGVLIQQLEKALGRMAGRRNTDA